MVKMLVVLDFYKLSALFMLILQKNIPFLGTNIQGSKTPWNLNPIHTLEQDLAHGGR